MLVAELIRRSRDGGELSAVELEQLVTGITDGTVTDAQVGALAMAILWRGLGGGRARETDAVDHSVGLTDVAGLGERVGPGERPLAVVHADDEDSADRAATAIRDAYQLGDAPMPSTDPVLEVQRAV